MSFKARNTWSQTVAPDVLRETLVGRTFERSRFSSYDYIVILLPGSGFVPHPLIQSWLLSALIPI